MRLIIALLFTTLCFSQTRVKQYIVDCNDNTVVRESLEVKELVFVSGMLPMSYCSEIIIHTMVGSGEIVSPSDFDTYPKNNEAEPIVKLIGCKSDFPNLRISKHITVIYKCNE